MGITRRRFMGFLAGAAAAVAVQARGLAKMVFPPRERLAAGGGPRPIPVKQLDAEEIGTPGRWRG